MTDELINFIKNVGHVEQRIRDLLQLDTFNNLSKHNEFFQSEHDDENEKLYDLRILLKTIEEDLLKCLDLLSIDKNDE